MKDIRAWWAGDEKGWMLDSQTDIHPVVIDAYRRYLIGVQLQRFRGLMPGEKKDECGRTIKALQDGRIQVNIVGIGEHAIFDAYKSDKIISYS